MKKYELVETDKTTPFGNPLFQVVALRDFGDVRKGDLGGYIESTYNLSHKGNCWVFGDAQVYGNVLVAGNAEIYDTTEPTHGYAFDTKDNGNGAQSASEKPKTCHGGQTGKFCSNCGEPFEPLPVEDAKSVIDYVRTAIDFDQRTAAWALDEMEGILNNWGHLHGMDLYLEADELVEPACDHVTGGVPDEEGKAMVFRYCPKCGEKL